MRKKTVFQILCGLCAIVIVFLFSVSCSKTTEQINGYSDYIVIHSRSRVESSGMFGIDNNGIVTEKFKNSKMQDLSFFSFDNQKLLVSGGRRNNNMLFDLSKKGMYSEIHWLNEPQYSGVTAVELLNNSVLAIMNGNYTENTYLNLLVEQDYECNVIQQTVVELYTRDLSCLDNFAKLVGKHLSRSKNTDEWKASIIDYNVSEQKITQQYDYSEYNCFWEIIETDSVMYCLAEDKNERINTICAINKHTFEIEKYLQIEDQLCGMYFEDNALYVVGNTAIYNIQTDTFVIAQSYPHEDIPERYVDWAYVYDGHYYVMFRYSQRIKDGSEYEYGKLFKVNLSTFEKEETPIRYDRKTTIDDLLVFPTEMFVEEFNATRK